MISASKHTLETLQSRSFNNFESRHIGPNDSEIKQMLQFLGISSLNELVQQVVPQSIQTQRKLKTGPAQSEEQVLQNLKQIFAKNKVYQSYIGMGYHDCFTPKVILRNILENPGWYTQYTPYQAEISQGRLEALLNFQTMIADLTGLPIANASLLDEATAAAEAMTMCFALTGRPQNKKFLVSSHCHPQTIDVLQTRAEPLGIELEISEPQQWQLSSQYFAVLVQNPNTQGEVKDYSQLCANAQQHKIMTIMAVDLLALTLLKSPGEMGADIAIGNSQRFGVPMGFGGPHAAFLSTKDEFKRQIPGRLVGLSKDVHGNPAIRLALQTREQHIRRDKATSNICTAQVLLAVMSSMYAVYHGPEGLKKIALKTQQLTNLFASGLKELGYVLYHENFFDTLTLKTSHVEAAKIKALSEAQQINLRYFDNGFVGISFDETKNLQDVQILLSICAQANGQTNKPCTQNFNDWSHQQIDINAENLKWEKSLLRTSAYLQHPTFNSYHSETEMLRYMYRLQNKDLSLAVSMIPLGSCTMKLNATTEMIPVTWPEVGRMHPYAPAEQTQGYLELFKKLENHLADITGFDAVSLQPNAGSQGEYAGLLVIREFLKKNAQGHRNICLIPQSAHGTNPASAAMVGMQVVVTKCDAQGNIDLADLKAKISEHQQNLAALMVTYPSTHGVFEENIKEICQMIHQAGGQVYMDGANMNAQVGLCSPGEIGADVCHLNLHKTFCIPHGGGGPGMGPIGVKAHLAPYLPTSPVARGTNTSAIHAISAAPWGSASILPISFAYIEMMGAEGLTKATQVAILSANYMAAKLDPHYPVLFKGRKARVAHECIIDARQFKNTAQIEVEDIAKRLMDYGFHAPTMSFPVPGTLMIEPTESESLAELDRFCEAMILIRKEIATIEAGKMDKANNPLKHAPHTSWVLSKPEWNHPYSREQAVFPAPWLHNFKFWPHVGRIDNVYGDRNLMCSCPSTDSYNS